jgi:hypothetical protein
VIFVVAAAIHFGVLLAGYRHGAAGTAESVIAVVLLLGLALTWAPSPWPGRAAMGAQVVAILGVLVGLFTMAVGVGPRTKFDLVLHDAMLVVLLVGLAITVRTIRTPPRRGGRAGGRA